jgi:hypothetical protein
VSDRTRRPRRDDDYDNEDDYDEPRRPRRKPKRRRGGVPTVVIVLLCLLPVLGGGGFLVYWLVNRGADKPSERLMGKWESSDASLEGGKMTLDFRSKTEMVAKRIKGGRNLTLDVHWEVVKEKKDEVHIRVWKADGTGKKNEWRIELLKDGQMRVTNLIDDVPSLVFKRLR